MSEMMIIQNTKFYNGQNIQISYKMMIIIYVYKNNAIYVEDKYSINVHRNMSYIRTYTMINVGMEREITKLHILITKNAKLLHCSNV